MRIRTLKYFSLCAVILHFISCKTRNFYESGLSQIRSESQQTEFHIRPIDEEIRVTGNSIENLKGYVVRVENLSLANFVVPDGRKYPVNCNRVEHSNITQEACVERDQPPKCEELTMNFETDDARLFPMHTLQEWHKMLPARLMVNGNWFNIDGPISYPYTVPCTQIFGLSVSDGETVSPADLPDLAKGQRNLLDALVVLNQNPPHKVRIVPNSELQGLSNIDSAVGGFIILKDGEVIRSDQLPGSVKDNSAIARTGVGLSKDGDTAFFVVVQAGKNFAGIRAVELAEYLKSLGATEGINLDNSGSSQLLYVTDDGDIIETLPGDLPLEGGQPNPHRPVPNFIGLW